MSEGSTAPAPLVPVLDAADLHTTMPRAAAFFAEVGRHFGQAHVVAAIKAAIALRRAVQADDYTLVNALYREFKAQRIAPAHAVEAGLELGVAPEAMREFAARHRAKRREAA